MSSASARGRAGKFSKPKRGGGKHFSRDLQPVNADGEVISMWAARDTKVDEESEEESEEDSSEEESSEGESGQQEVQTREQRKALAKARKEAAIAKQKAAAKAAAPGDLPPSESEEESDDDMPANPNHTSKARQQLAAEDAAPIKDKPVAELSRREREALQAQQARERYQKLHAEGKTDEARADLERLRLVREQREAAAARKKAEAEEKAEADKARKEQLDKERKQRDAAMGAGASKRGRRGGKKK